MTVSKMSKHSNCFLHQTIPLTLMKIFDESYLKPTFPVHTNGKYQQFLYFQRQLSSSLQFPKCFIITNGKVKTSLTRVSSVKKTFRDIHRKITVMEMTKSSNYTIK